MGAKRKEKLIRIAFPNVSWNVVEDAYVRNVGGLPLGADRERGWTTVRMTRDAADRVLYALQDDYTGPWARRAVHAFALALGYKFI